MLLLILEMIAFAGIVLGLYSLRRYFGLTLLYFFVAGNQFVQNLLAGTLFFLLLDRYPISPGSAVFFSGGLFAILLVYVRESIPKTRNLIYGIVFANLSLALLAKSVQWGLQSGVLTQTDSAIDWTQYYTSGVFVFGAVLLTLDSFLIIVAYEFLRRLVGWLGEWLRLVLALAIVLAFDALLFASFAFRSLPNSRDLLVGNLSGKLLAAFVYGSLLWVYLRLVRAGERADEGRAEIIDPFSIFTYRRRYQRLEAEKLELEQAHDQEITRARIALSGADLGLWDWNIQGGSTYLDDRWAGMLGYTREEVVPQIDSWETRIHPDDRARVEEVLQEHLDGRSSVYDVEHRLRTKSGSWKWVQSIGKVVERDDSGAPLRMSGTHIDIDERKRAEEELEKAEKRYRELFELAPFMYVTTGDTDGTPFVKDCNSAFLETLGYERDEVIGQPLGEFYTKRSAQELLGDAGYRQSLKGLSVRRERQLMTKDGRVVPTLLSAQPERGPDGRIVGARAMFVDISERKKAEEALRESEARLEEAQRIARVGDWEQDFRTGRETWSAGHYEIFGLDPASFAPDVEAFFDRVHPDDRDQVRKVYDKALSGTDPQNLEFRVIRSDGEVRTVVTKSRAETDAAGNLVRMHGTIQDVTEQKRAEEEILASREQLRRLAAGIEATRESERAAIAREIHDELGQALTGLKMDLSTLRPRLVGDNEEKRYEGMVSLVDATIQTVRDLSTQLRPPVLDDLGLVEAIDWQVAEFARRSEIECSLDLAAGDVDLDETVSMAVFRILQEALTNVARHAEADAVDVALRRDKSMLFLAVRDNGRGMDSEEIDRGSLGLLGMRERAVSVGGMLTVGPAEGGGTLVSLSVPL